jgi:ATP-dependent DNA ligase
LWQAPKSNVPFVASPISYSGLQTIFELRAQSSKGEIARVDESGQPAFRDLLFRKRQCIFFAFDLLYLNGKDLRTLPLIERKALLKKSIKRKRTRLLYVDHIENDGRLFFDEVVKMDLEGIACKRKNSPYKVTEKPSPHWIKVKNRRYSELEGREELFDRV